jgi:hypothetical protein
MGIGQWLKTNVFKRNFGIDAVQEAPVHASVDLDQVAGRWRAAGARLVERFEKIVVVHLSANSRLVIDNERASFDGAIDHEAMIAGLKHVQGELDGIFKPEGPDLFKVEAWAYAKVYAEVYGVKIDYTPPHRLLRDAAAMLTKVEALREQELGKAPLPAASAVAAPAPAIAETEFAATAPVSTYTTFTTQVWPYKVTSNRPVTFYAPVYAPIGAATAQPAVGEKPDRDPHVIDFAAARAAMDRNAQPSRMHDYVPPHNALMELFEATPKKLRGVMLGQLREIRQGRPETQWPQAAYHYGMGRNKAYEAALGKLSAEERLREIARCKVLYESTYRIDADLVIHRMRALGYSVEPVRGGYAGFKGEQDYKRDIRTIEADRERRPQIFSAARSERAPVPGPVRPEPGNDLGRDLEREHTFELGRSR